jgi:hypothetical protein
MPRKSHQLVLAMGILESGHYRLNLRTMDKTHSFDTNRQSKNGNSTESLKSARVIKLYAGLLLLSIVGTERTLILVL